MRGRAPDPSRAGLSPTDIEFPGIRGVRYEPVEGSRTPTGIASSRLHPTLEQVLGQPKESPPVLEIADKQFLHYRAFGRLDMYPCRVAGPIWMQAISIRRD